MKWTSMTATEHRAKSPITPQEPHFDRGSAFARGLVFLCMGAILCMILGGAVQLLLGG